MNNITEYNTTMETSDNNNSCKNDTDYVAIGGLMLVGAGVFGFVVDKVIKLCNAISSNDYRVAVKVKDVNVTYEKNSD